MKKLKPIAPNQDIIDAFLTPLIRDAEPADIFKELNQAIAKAHLDTGYKIHNQTIFVNGEPVDLYSQTLNDMVLICRMRYDKMHVKEITIAIERGSIGDYGEFMGLSKKTYVHFIKCYLASNERLNVLALYKQTMSDKKVIPTLKEQFDTALNNVMIAQAAFKTQRALGTAGAVVYNFLNDIGLITYSKEVKDEIYNQARYRVIDEKKLQKLNSDFLVRQALELSITRLQENAELSDDQAAIKARAKAIVMVKYFGDIETSNADIKKLVEGKRQVFYDLKKANV